MRYLALTLAFFSVTALAIVAMVMCLSPGPVKRIAKNRLASVSVFVVNEDDEITKTGSGFVVSAKNRFVLTAAHVVTAAVSGANLVLAFPTPSGRYDGAVAYIVNIDYDRDFALLWAPEAKFTSEVILGSDQKLLPGSFIYAIANILGTKYQVYSQGYFSGRSNLGLMVDMKGAPGASGGCVFDIDGKLVGIAQKLDNPPLIWAFTHAAPVSQIRPFLLYTNQCLSPAYCWPGE